MRQKESGPESSRVSFLGCQVTRLLEKRVGGEEAAVAAVRDNHIAPSLLLLLGDRWRFLALPTPSIP